MTSSFGPGLTRNLKKTWCLFSQDLTEHVLSRLVRLSDFSEPVGVVVVVVGVGGGGGGIVVIVVVVVIVAIVAIVVLPEILAKAAVLKINIWRGSEKCEFQKTISESIFTLQN